MDPRGRAVDRVSLGHGSPPQFAAAADTGLIVTYEDHTVVGGLGSAVAAVVLAGHPVPVLPFGVRDEFCSRTAEHAEMLTDYGIGPESMADAIRRRLEAGR